MCEEAGGESQTSSILKGIRPRSRELREAWKPVGLALSILSAFKAITEFYHRTGPFFYVSLALLALSVTILFTIPIKSVRLLAARLVAFVVDLTFLGLLTYAVVDLLFKSQVIKPSAVISMAIVWAWFFLFVLLDWRFRGTPGKLILGLRLGKRNGSPTLLTCLARSLLILVVPLIGPGRLLTIPTASRLESFVQWSAGLSLLSLLPLSIAFSGGQSLPDLLLGTAVVLKGSNANQYPSRLNRRGWLFLSIASLFAGVIFAFAASIGSLELKRKVPEPPIEQLRRSGETEARVAAKLRPYIAAGVPNADDYLQNVQVISAAGELPSDSDEVRVPAACQESFKVRKAYQIVRAQISPEAPFFIKTQLFANLIKTADLYSDRPAFLVFEVSTRESFGVFSVVVSENYMFCLTNSAGRPENQLVDLNASIWTPGSINELALLLLGEMDSYSQAEKVPIWLH